MSPSLLDTPTVIYLAGPMQGYPEFNFPTFHAVTYCLRQNGHRVFNPAEKDIERHNGTNIAAGNMTGSLEQLKAEHASFSLRAALAEDMEFICREAKCLVTLPGWEKSLGAQAEHRTAVALARDGMQIVYLHQALVDLMKVAYAQREAA